MSLFVVVYLMVTMTLGTISICVTVLVLNVHHRYPSHRPRLWLRRLILIHVARLLRVTTSYSQASREAEQVWKRRPGFEPRPYFQMNGIVSSNEDNVKTRLKSRLNNGQRLKDYFTRSLLRHQPHQHQRHPPNHHNSSSMTTTMTHRSSAPFPKSTADEETQNQQTTATKDYGPEWRELAQVLDRLFFWILCILMTSSTVFILLYPKYSGIEGSW